MLYGAISSSEDKIFIITFPRYRYFPGMSTAISSEPFDRLTSSFYLLGKIRLSKSTTSLLRFDDSFENVKFAQKTLQITAVSSEPLHRSTSYEAQNLTFLNGFPGKNPSKSVQIKGTYFKM